MIGPRERPVRAGEREQQSSPEHHQPDCGHELPTPSQLHQQVTEEVGESNLRQDVDQLGLDLVGTHPDQHLAHDDQPNGPGNDMVEILRSE